MQIIGIISVIKKINIGRSLVHSSHDEQQPITGSDISDTLAQELALFREKGLEIMDEYT